MLRPFERFRRFYIDEFKKLGKIYLVTQSYSRHEAIKGEKEKAGILVSDYDDKGLAKGHYQAIKNAKDKYAFILDLTNEKHLNKFSEMISADSDYAVYWAAVRSKQLLQKQMNNKYKDNIRNFLSKNTKWPIDRDTSINPKLQVIFGELFVMMGFRNEEIKVKFEDIEKL